MDQSIQRGTLAGLFPDESYQFRMRFQRCAIADFFRPTAQDARLLAEREFWLRTEPARSCALLPEGVSLLDEAIDLALSEQTIAESARVELERAADPLERCLALGRGWEPDFLLLRTGRGGQPSLWAGCVCFPSSWSLAEKMGRPVDFIHSVVPGLNAAIGAQIQTFLSNMKPGFAWMRFNWGLSRSPELNQHPERGLPRLDASVRLDEVWLRVEDQALVALPRSGGILFGIRILTYPLAAVKQDRTAARGLSRALASMPEEVARYKNLAAARETILKLLESD